MLKQMREGAKSKLLKFTLFGLLIMAMGGLAIMDIGGTLRRGIGSNIAEYKGGKISVIEFNRSLREVLHQQRISEVDAYKMGFPSQILQRDINKILMSKAAQDIGLRMDDKQAALQVKEIISPLVDQGLSEKEALDHVLMNSNMSERQFLETIKTHISTQKLAAIILGNAFPDPNTEADLVRYENETRNGKYFTISFEDIAKVPAPSTETLKEYYGKITGEYVIPEYRDISFFTLSKTSVETQQDDISEEKLKEAYEENIENFATPETREIAQIITKSKDIADTIFKDAKSENNLEETSKKFEAQYIKPNKFNKNTIAQELSEQIFSAEQGAVLEPIETPLGWHVVMITKITPQEVASFEKVKDVLKKELQQEALSEALYKIADKIDDAVAGGSTLQEIAKEHNFDTKNLSNIKSDGKNKEGKKISSVSDKTLSIAFTLDEGATSNLIEEADGSFTLIKADKVIPSANIPFEEVKSEIEKRWITKEKVKLLSEKASEIIEKIKTPEDFTNTANKMGKTIKETGYIKRTPAKDDKDSINVNVRDTLFSISKKGSTATANGGSEALYIVNLAGNKIPAYKDISEKDKEAANKALKKEAQEDMFEQYMSSLMSKYKAKINHGVLDHLYQQALSQAESSAE